MVVSDLKFKRLQQRFLELEEQIEDLGPRLRGAESVAQQHGDRHNDEGGDPILGTALAGHSHFQILTPTIRGTSRGSENAAGLTVSVTYPSDIEKDEVLLMFYWQADSTQEVPTWTTTDLDWTLVGTAERTDENDALHAVWKVADGTESGTFTVTHNSTGDDIAYHIYRLFGASRASTPSIAVTTLSDDQNPPSLTPAAGKKQYLWFAATGEKGVGGISTPPTNYEGFIQDGNELSSCHRAIETATEDPPTFGGGGGSHRAMTVAVHPTAIVQFGLTEAAHAQVDHSTAFGPTSLSGWDVILEPTGGAGALIQSKIDAGARKILLLDGTWFITDQNVTWDSTTGVEIWGQTRGNTKLDFGTNANKVFIISGSGFLGNLTIQNSPTDATRTPVSTSSGGVTLWNIDFASTSGNGVLVGGTTSAQTRIIDCIFQGVPDSGTGQLHISKPALLLIQGCEFIGASAAGAAILNIQPVGGPAFFPDPNIVISNCYGQTLCAEGWFSDAAAGLQSTVTIVGNSIATNGDALAIDIAKATAVVLGNTFIVSASQITAAAMINVSGGQVMIEGNHLEANTTRTDVIDINDSTGKHVVTGNLILGGSSFMTNAIHLAGSGDNSIVSNNRCDGTDIRIASGSTGNVVALNIVNAIVGSTTANQIGPNVTGA